MSKMLVNSRSSQKCCKEEYVEYGKSNNGKAKDKFRRTLKRRDRQNWKKEI